MTDSEIKYLSVEEAAKLVGAIQEEEDIERQDRRILTVYSRDDREVCWFDYDEIMEIVKDVAKGEKQEAVQDYILAHIPDWTLEL
ncbi:MAG: hypothetical protein JRC87_10160 [Deltaproteobacteria bacterium]|nr:hypothetical protein [Deltaproteobacteria bacterium]MBW2659934.1 hypothetical protein [Deltaproteobacteria bacterium]